MSSQRRQNARDNATQVQAEEAHIYNDYNSKYSVIARLLFNINIVAKEGEKKDLTYKAKDIFEKIETNQVGFYKEIIEELYSQEGHLIEEAYRVLTEEDTYSVMDIKKYLRFLYLDLRKDILKEYNCNNLEELWQIPEFGEKILERSVEQVLDQVEESRNIEDLSTESAWWGTRLIVVHSFIECNILEAP